MREGQDKQLPDRSPRRQEILGSDGITTLLLSTLVISVTLGLSLAIPLLKVYRTARTARCSAVGAEYLLVMGARLDHDRITTRFRLRLDRALLSIQSEQEQRIVLLGGVTAGNRLSEAEAGYRYLLEKGIDADHIILEDKSRHTLENLKNARPLVQARPGALTILSNRFHLARCSALARGLGLEHRLCAAESELPLSLGMGGLLLLEAFYLHWYETGKRWSHWTGNRKSLERIS